MLPLVPGIIFSLFYMIVSITLVVGCILIMCYSINAFIMNIVILLYAIIIADVILSLGFVIASNRSELFAECFLAIYLIPTIATIFASVVSLLVIYKACRSLYKY